MFFILSRRRPLECRSAGRGVRVGIGEYRGVVRVPRRVFQRLLPERPIPERCLEANYLQRTRFELRRRQLTEDGNVEISGARSARGLVGGVPGRAAPGGWSPALT